MSIKSFYTVLDELENVYADIIIWEDNVCTVKYTDTKFPMNYDTIDDLLNRLPTNYIVIKDGIRDYCEDENYTEKY